MKKLYSLSHAIAFIICSLLYSSDSFCQNYQWAKNIADGSGNSIITDALGNVYVTGSFQGSPDFDPGPGSASLTSKGGDDIFFAKYDSNGNYLWAKSIGSTNADYGQSIAFDAGGNVYIAGSFSLTADFDPGPGTVNLTSGGNADMFFAKYDSNGNYVWAKSTGATGFESTYGIAIDAAGNVCVTGTFQNTVDFDMGPGTANLNSAGTYDIFFAKYDSNGNYLWAKSIGTTNGDFGNGITLDATGNIYITGYFQGAADFDPGPGTANLSSAGTYDVFFAKYDGNGNYLWAKSIGGTSTDLGFSIAIDSGGNVYITGHFQGTADFDPGPGTVNLVSAGSLDVFFAKYDSNGNYLWAKRIGATSVDQGFSITVDAGGSVYISGAFTGTTDFDPGPGTANLISAGLDDIFFGKYDGNGNYLWAKNIGGTSNDYGKGITISAVGNVYITGYFKGTADFDTGPGTATLIAGGQDIFFAKYGACASAPSTPGIISGNTTICEFTNQTYSIAPVAGAISYSWSTPGGFVGTSTTNILNTTAGVNSGNIIVTASNACGTSPSQTVAIQVNNAPLTPGVINGLNTICSGAGSTTYSIAAVVAATSYTWMLPGGWSGSSATNTISTTPGSTGIFTVTASNLCGTSPQKTLNVTVNPLPTINASTTNTMLCIGQTATLTASGASTYTWNTTATTTAIAVSPSVTTVYTVTGTDANGCTNSSSFTQSVSTCAGIDQISNSVSQIQVYPNPFNTKITVVSNSEMKPVLIYNALGALIFKTEIKNEKIEIDLSKESSGIYSIRIGTEIKKIIKE